MNQIRVFAPATIANLGAGFDLLGLAIDAPGDIISARMIPEKKLVFISDPAYPALPSDHRNVACHVAQKVYEMIRPDSGIEITLQKNIPPGSGMGGSAASSAAAACAVNWLFGGPFSKSELLPYVLLGENLAAGSPHADNAAPSLLGGLCLLSPERPERVIQLPVKNRLYWIVVHPEYECNTRSMRELLPRTLPLATHTTQASHLARLICGFLMGHSEWIAEGLKDHIAEPVRAPHIPGFHAVQLAAFASGAISVGISGSGPALFAAAKNAAEAKKIATAMKKAFLAAANLDSKAYVSRINLSGTIRMDN